MTKDNSLLKRNVSSKINYSNIRLTVDEPDDLDVIKNLFDHFYPDIDFSFNDIKTLLENKPEIFQNNNHLNRNEGSLINTGPKLYKRAKKVIPGGTMLLSKRPEMFLPEKWPSYYSKAMGCNIWDLDDNKYIDMSIMGVGTNTLGYCHPEIDQEVKKAIGKGNMSTLNCPEEVYLSERLISLHPWAEMVRFARTGGEANAISVRIARAATGKSNIAVCGYHGWHDWYLSSNLSDDTNLNQHLLPGLKPNGIPSELLGTVIPFPYNNLDELNKIISNNDIGVIKMEVSRSVEPEDGYLNSIRKIADENNIILIFDECTSGFRETFGGLHKKYGVEPDMMVLGKAMGNGYAITAVLGKRDVMQIAEETFISSTFWTERIGPTAALKTLEIMEREKSWELITKIGKNIRKRWKSMAQSNGLPINVSGLPALISFDMPVNNWLKYKTYITQEMLKEGFLATSSVYVSIKHNEQIINEYFELLKKIFSTISDCENGKSILPFGSTSMHTGFNRLN